MVVLIFENHWKGSFIFGRALAKLHELVLLLVKNLLVELQLLGNVVVPFLLHLKIEAVLRLIVVPFLKLDKLLQSAVESLSNDIFKLFERVLLLGVHPPEELQAAQSPD